MKIKQSILPMLGLIAVELQGMEGSRDGHAVDLTQEELNTLADPRVLPSCSMPWWGWGKGRGVRSNESGAQRNPVQAMEANCDAKESESVMFQPNQADWSEPSYKSVRWIGRDYSELDRLLDTKLKNIETMLEAIEAGQMTADLEELTKLVTTCELDSVLARTSFENVSRAIRTKWDAQYAQWATEDAIPDAAVRFKAHLEVTLEMFRAKRADLERYTDMK